MKLDAYLALQVPELWVYDCGLTLYVLKDNRYLNTEKSPTFPEFAIQEIVEQVVTEAQQLGSSRALRAFEDTL